MLSELDALVSHLLGEFATTTVASKRHRIATETLQAAYNAGHKTGRGVGLADALNACGEWATSSQCERAIRKLKGK